MNDFTSLDDSSTAVPPTSISISSTDQNTVLLDPATLKTLDQISSLTLICITVWLYLYTTVRVFSNSVRLMEQINRFIELLVKKN
ncbi:hypothetical protein [Leptolyngbya sp. FACHB-17]|uniref:hypothetical protein n=1 Tax=unclassified Leptolyngbya TaxID=2650499 RepID=UPI001680B83E|nr:hypothetical protein [Leptolyngbya sp. FACHB-17]MBD2078444.1 hypothetical protein [Leptolyngbya sp. FACHB-17]